MMMYNEPTCASSSRKKMKLRRHIEQPADVISHLEKDEYRLINEQNLSFVLSQSHGRGERIYL